MKISASWSLIKRWREPWGSPGAVRPLTIADWTSGNRDASAFGVYVVSSALDLRYFSFVWGTRLHCPFLWARGWPKLWFDWPEFAGKELISTSSGWPGRFANAVKIVTLVQWVLSRQVVAVVVYWTWEHEILLSKFLVMLLMSLLGGIRSLESSFVSIGVWPASLFASMKVTVRGMLISGPKSVGLTAE